MAMAKRRCTVLILDAVMNTDLFRATISSRMVDCEKRVSAIAMHYQHFHNLMHGLVHVLIVC